MDRERARQHDEDAERLRREGAPADALAALEAAIAADPDCPNAHNLAGWLLSSELRDTPLAAARALRHFEEAHARFPDDHVALANLADALTAAGQAERAVRAVEDALAKDPHAVRPHAWLGWHHLIQTRDLDRALAHLRTAAAYGGLWGPAHQHLGVAREAKGDLAGAYAAYARAIECGDAHDVPLVHARMGALQQAWGRPRRALSMFRRALYHERARCGPRADEIAAAVRALETALSARGAYYPHEDDERAWIEAEGVVRRSGGARDAWQGGSEVAVQALRAFREQAASALGALGQDPRGEVAARVVRRALTAARDQRLLPEHANERLDIDVTPLGEAARARVDGIAASWRRVHAVLYARLLAREEPEQAETPKGRIAALIEEDRHDDALAALRSSGNYETLLECAGIAERAGDDAGMVVRSARARA